jgi:hypothetical protein
MDFKLPSKAKVKAHWRKFGLYYLLIATLVSAVPILILFPSQDKTVVRPLLAVAKPSPGLSLLATLSSNELHESETAILRLEASSDPATKIDTMRVCVFAPEFTAAGPDGTMSECVPVEVFNKGDVRSKPTPAEIDLRPKEASGSAKILVTVSWIRFVRPASAPVSAKGKAGSASASCADHPGSCVPVREQVEMTLGPVSLGVDRKSRFAGRFASFLKDLTLPIILIFLANWLTQRASAHEEEKQIAHILLPKVMRLAGRYYLPLTFSAATFVKKSAGGRSNIAELAFYLLSFFNVARALKEKEGGVFFVDMAAERIFMNGNNVIKALLVKALNGEKPLMDCLDQLEAWVPTGKKRWARFADRPSAVPNTWTEVETWLTGLKDPEFQAIRYLFNVVAATLRYEGNAPFASWYSNSRGENLFELQEGTSAPKSDVFGAAYAQALKEFEKYLALYKPGKEA